MATAARNRYAIGSRLIRAIALVTRGAIALSSLHSTIVNIMQATITIPQGWGYPRLTFGTRTQQGQIVGLKYYPFDSLLGQEYGEGWRYILLSDNQSDEEIHRVENEIVPLNPEELRQHLEAEIAKRLQEIALLTQELLAIPIVSTAKT